MTIEQTLAERGERYGSFEEHAEIAQGLQELMRGTGGWKRLAADQRQALTVIADKIARMLNGQPAYRDNWHDIVGYAKLVDDRMARDEPKAPVVPVRPAATPSVPTLEVDWGSQPWATHLLSSRGRQVFAELEDGEYFGPPSSDVGYGRLQYVVSLAPMAFKVIATRPGYAGPKTRKVDLSAIAIPEPEAGQVDFAARDCAEPAPVYPSRPDGGRWRDNRSAGAPLDMSEEIEAVLMNGDRVSQPAHSLHWGQDVSVGVAWWRFA